MDLTNIKPGVECKHCRICFALSSVNTAAVYRIGKLLGKGYDCFEEVDDG